MLGGRLVIWFRLSGGWRPGFCGYCTGFGGGLSMLEDVAGRPAIKRCRAADRRLYRRSMGQLPMKWGSTSVLCRTSQVDLAALCSAGTSTQCGRLACQCLECGLYWDGRCLVVSSGRSSGTRSQHPIARARERSWVPRADLEVIQTGAHVAAYSKRRRMSERKRAREKVAARAADLSGQGHV